MKRAAVFIGVDNTGGGLPQLNDAAKSARRMADEWAKEQGISPVKVLTDEGGKKVTATQVLNAVTAILRRGDVEQLIVYFAGHGINKASNEYWLLSGAPELGAEAVNVSGSEDLAKHCGVPHVIFISDACRSAAEGIVMQRVQGIDVFPNKLVTREAKDVDLYFACRVGDPALEIKDPRKSARAFKAVFTAELIDALLFRRPGIVERAVDGGKLFAYIRPFELKEHLKQAVPERIGKMKLPRTVIQEPEGRIIQRKPPGWLSRRVELRRAKGGSGGMSGGGPGPGGGELAMGGMGVAIRRPPLALAVKAVKRRTRATPASISSGLIQTALATPRNLAGALESARKSRTSGKKELARAALAVAAPFGPDHQESQCGFKVRGARFVAAIALRGRIEMTTCPADVVRVWNVPRKRATLVLLILDNGNGIVLPAEHEFLAALTIQDGNLVDVSYEPSSNTGRWRTYPRQMKELRALRAVIASATRQGAFRLDSEDALALARRMQEAKGFDPSLAVYAAYAYNDLRRVDLVAQMHGYQQYDLGNALFDVAMFAHPPGPKSRQAMERAIGFAPLLSQGWAYLNSRRIQLPRGLGKLPESLVPSVWTQFDPEGVALLRRSLFRKEKP